MKRQNLIMHKISGRNLFSQQGLGMMEVVITILIMTIGLLGMVTLQLTTLRGATISNQRYIASDLAYDISERMRANPGNLADYVDVSTLAFTKNCKDNKKVQCTVAESDIFWLKFNMEQIDQVLPGADLVVTESGGTYTATVTWNELKALQNASTQGTANFEQQTYTMEFRI